MLRIKSEMEGLTQNERRVQEAVNEVLDATSKKLQEIADKREAAAGRDASAEVLAEYDKQAEAVQRLGEQYAELARIQETSSIQAQQTFSYGWNTAFAQYAEDSENYAKMAGDMFASFTGSMSSAIDNFVEHGKFAFGDFAASVIKDLIKIELKMQASQLLRAGIGMITSAIGMYSGGGFGTGNSFGNADIGGFLAEGGPADAGTAYVVGERGPEIFVPNRSGTVIPNHALGGGGGDTYVTNNYIDAIDTKSFEDRIYGSSRAVWSANQFASKSISNNRSRT
jgi:phage-related minor tail protein